MTSGGDWMMRLLVLIGVIVLFGACASAVRTVTVDLPSAEGIQTGAPVRFGGVPIGRVQAVAPTRHGVRLFLLIDHHDVPLRSGDSVAVRPDGILGSYALDIVLGPDTAALIGQHASLATASPDSAAPIRQVITRAVVNEMIDQFRRADTTRAAHSTKSAPRP
jgi:ABC-type transporter Mla subunit MlaD